MGKDHAVQQLDVAALRERAVTEAAVGADGPLFAVGSGLRKAGLAGMTQSFCENGLLKGGIGGDDLLDRGQHGGLEMGGLHGVGQKLLPAGPVHRHGGKVGFG